MCCHIKRIVLRRMVRWRLSLPEEIQGYSFEWFRNAATTGKTTATATGLVGDNYIVSVSRNGCTTTASKVVNDQAVEPNVTATSTPVQNCQNPNSGSVTADAVIGGVVQDPAGFTFNWYFHNKTTTTEEVCYLLFMEQEEHEQCFPLDSTKWKPLIMRPSVNPFRL